MTTAVLFDLDGVLLDSEQTWDEARRSFVATHGGTWRSTATRTMMGMSAPEWSQYLHDELGVRDPPASISEGVAALVLAAYHERLPLLPHAAETVRVLADRWPLGLASSSNRPVIDAFLDGSGLRACFAVVVSSEEVTHGKPAPDVYLAAATGLRVPPSECVAVEDSTNGIRSAHAAGTHVVAIPNRHFPPEVGALDLAARVVPSLADLTPEAVMAAAGA